MNEIKDVKLKFKGVELELETATYIIPRLGLNAFTDYDIDGIIKEMQANTGFSSKNVSNLLLLLYLAAKRNYPNLELETFKDEIDIRALGDITKLIGYLIGQDVIEPKDEELAKKPQATKKKK